MPQFEESSLSKGITIAVKTGVGINDAEVTTRDSASGKKVIRTKTGKTEKIEVE